MFQFVTLTVFLVVALLSTQAFQLAPRPSPLHITRYSSSSRASNKDFASFSFKLNVKSGDNRKISRNEEEEYFESNFDKLPLKDRLPAAFAFLGAVSLPFIVGLIYLYTNK